jgi:hypothetical protein
MKNQFNEYMNLVKGFMRKNALLIISVKVLKLLLVLFLVSCGGKQSTDKKPDTVRVDSIGTDMPGDSTMFKNQEEDEEGEEEDNGNPMVPQES